MQDPPPPPLPIRPAPVPVQQLNYSDPPRRGRPGLVTAIGVISIVVASLSILFSLQTGGTAIMFFFMSRMMASMPASSTGTTTTSGTGVYASSSSLTISGPGVTATTPATVPSATLTPAEVQQVITKVQSNLGAATLNPAQVATLQTELQSPTQALVTPGTAWSPVTSATTEVNGTADLDLSGGSIQIDATGKVLTQSSASAGFTIPRMKLGALILSVFDSVGSLALAVMLLVAGIATLRDSRRAFRMHRIYGWAKIPMAIVGGIAYGWLMSGFMSGMPGAAGTATNWVFGVYAAFLAALGCAYPIGLLIALRANSVRAYYHSIVESGG